MKLPNFFILGAPKCGTTSLTYWLNQHHEVFEPRIKEPYFFYSGNGKKITKQEYFELYSRSTSDQKVVYDASTSYLFGECAAKILQVVQDAKFLVCLRNPLEMAPSWHWQERFSGIETIEEFEHAWNLSDQRAAGKPIGLKNIHGTLDPRLYAYKEVCKLGSQVNTLLMQVPRESVKFIFLDDLKENAERQFTSLCEWLGIQTNVFISYEAKNRAKKHRSTTIATILRVAGSIKQMLGVKSATGLLSPLHSVNTMEVRYPAPSFLLKKEMQETFKEDINLLAHLTDRDLSHWIKTANPQCR